MQWVLMGIFSIISFPMMSAAQVSWLADQHASDRVYLTYFTRAFTSAIKRRHRQVGTHIVNRSV